jgi:hypothetical protein
MSKKNGRKGFQIVYPLPHDPVGEYYGTGDKRINAIVSTLVYQAVSEAMTDVRTAMHKMLLEHIGDEMLGYAKELYAYYGRGALVARHEDLERLASSESDLCELSVAYQPQSDIPNMPLSLLSYELGLMVESYDVNRMFIFVVFSEDDNTWAYGLKKQDSESPQNKTEGVLP